LYSNARNNTLFSPTTYGLYKSTNGGTSWNKLTLPLSVQGSDTCPNDIELGADGTIWVSSTNSWTHRNGGGRVFHQQITVIHLLLSIRLQVTVAV